MLQYSNEHKGVSNQFVSGSVSRDSITKSCHVHVWCIHYAVPLLLNLMALVGCLFKNNWVSKGGKFENEALNHPILYPEGDVTIQIPKIEGISGKYARIGWAHQSKNKGKHTCLGVFVCPQFGVGCHY